MMRLIPAAAAFLLIVPVVAQVTPGSIGVTGFSTSQFSTVSPTGTATPLNIGSFGGTGPATSQSILWDPANPADFFVGGFGFLGRATVTGATATYTVLTTAVSEAAQMSYSPAGDLVVADSGMDQVLLVSPVNGAMVALTTGPQPWGGTMNAGASDPNTGDIFVGNNGSIFVVPFGMTTATVFVTGWTGGTSYVSGITFDPLSTDVIATLLGVNRVVRIDRVTGVMTDLIPAQSISGPNSITPDVTGDFIVGGGGGNVYRVPNVGGVATLVGTAGGQGGSASGVTVVAAGVGPPPFVLSVVPAGGGATFGLSGVPGAAVEGVTLLSFNVSLPVGAGPVFGGSPDLTTLLLLQWFPVATPGNLVHWTWPVSGLWPSTTSVLAPGLLPVGTPMDFVSIALDASTGIVGVTPPVRATF